MNQPDKPKLAVDAARFPGPIRRWPGSRSVEGVPAETDIEAIVRFFTSLDTAIDDLGPDIGDRARQLARQVRAEMIHHRRLDDAGPTGNAANLDIRPTGSLAAPDHEPHGATAASRTPRLPATKVLSTANIRLRARRGRSALLLVLRSGLRVSR